MHTGLVGILFDELANVIFTAEETKTMRKNILLHQLRQGTPSTVVQRMRNISELKSDEADLNDRS